MSLSGTVAWPRTDDRAVAASVSSTAEVEVRVRSATATEAAARAAEVSHHCW
jgi:hypothetical protein